MENEVIKGITAGVPKGAGTVGDGVTRIQFKCVLISELGLKGIEQCFKQKWDCFQIEEDLEKEMFWTGMKMTR